MRIVYGTSGTKEWAIEWGDWKLVHGVASTDEEGRKQAGVVLESLVRDGQSLLRNFPQSDLDDDVTITVCAECYQASCWQGIHMCDKATHANIVHVKVRVLRMLRWEHESYWLKSIWSDPTNGASSSGLQRVRRRDG
jgi:hypothetical protein